MKSCSTSSNPPANFITKFSFFSIFFGSKLICLLTVPSLGMFATMVTLLATRSAVEVSSKFQVAELLNCKTPLASISTKFEGALRLYVVPGTSTAKFPITLSLAPKVSIFSSSR